MWRCGLSKSPACDGGADQHTASHIITECPLYRPQNSLHDLIDVDADATTRQWLLRKSKVPKDLTISFISFGYLVSNARRRICIFNNKVFLKDTSNYSHNIHIDILFCTWKIVLMFIQSSKYLTLVLLRGVATTPKQFSHRFSKTRSQGKKITPGPFKFTLFPHLAKKIRTYHLPCG